MRESNERFHLPESMDEKLRQVRGRLSSVGGVTAVVLGIAVLLGAMLVAMLVDYLSTLYDSSWRSVLTYSAMAAAAVVLIGWGVIALQRWRRLATVAQEVDRRVPQLEERWSIVAEHAENTASTDTSHPAVLKRVAAEAARRGAGVTPGEVVSLNGLVRAFLALNAVTVVLVLAAVLDWRQTNVLVRRFWAPSANISATEIALQPGNVVVGRGEPLTLTASLTGKPVESARLAILGESDEEKRITLVPRRKQDNGPLTASHRLRKVDESFTYRVRAGDGQTEWNDVTVADRPSVATATLKITPPEYRNEKPKTFKNLPRRVSIVEGTKVELAIKPRGDVESFKLLTGDDYFQMLTPDADGWYRWSGEPETSLTLSPILTEPHGLTNRRPPVTQVRVYPDRPPVVRVLTPDDEIAVTPDDTVEISFVAQDDNGVGAAELVVYQQTADPILAEAGFEQVELERIPIDLGDAEGSKVVRGKVSLDLSKYELEDGSSLNYEVRVTERRSPRGQNPGGQSPSQHRAAQPNQLAGSPTAKTSTDSPPSASTAADAGESNPSSEMVEPDSAANDAALAESDTATAKRENTAVAVQATNLETEADATEAAPKDGDATAAEGLANADTPSTGQGGEEATSEQAMDEPATEPESEEAVAASDEKDEQAPGMSLPGLPLPQLPLPGLPMPIGSPTPGSVAENEGSPSDPPSDSTEALKPANAPSVAGGEPTAGGGDVRPRQEEAMAGGSPSGEKSRQSEPEPSDGESMQPSGGPADASERQVAAAEDGPTSEDADADGRSAEDSMQPTPEGMGDAEKQMASNDGAKAGQGGAPQPGDPSDMAPNRSAKSGQRSLVAAAPKEMPEGDERDGDSKSSETDNATGDKADPSAMASDSGDPPTEANGGENEADPSAMSDKASPGDAANRMASDSPNENQSTNPSASNSSSDNQSMASRSNSNNAGNPSEDNPDPGNSMTRRRLDMAQDAQSSSSNSMRVKIDKYAGSFAGQQRRKLEIAIAPDFARFHALLTRAEKLTRGVLDQLDRGEAWSPRNHRDVTSAEGDVRRGQKVVASLRDRTRGTPYAFVGLQLADISATNLNPAREHLWEAYQSKSAKRVESVRNGWQQVRRALDRLDSLVEEYEAAKQEFALADRAQQVKNMYRVFVEDSHLRLGMSPNERSMHSRKMAEFELDEEYLARLEEVLKMRQELLAELARILDDDPRLLRRFMNNFQEQTDSLLRQVTKLREKQETLARDSAAWADNQGERRDAVLAVLRKLRQEETHGLAAAAGNLAERFDAWLPFDAEGNDSKDNADDPASEAREQVAAIAARGQELARAADADDTAAAIAEAEVLYQSLREFEVALRRLGGNPRIEDIEGFAVRRILDTRALLTEVSSWLRRMQEIQKGQFHRAAAIEQYQLASDTDQLASKLGAVEQQLAGLLQRADGSLPSAIAEKSRALLAALDQKTTPNQLGAAIALQQPDWQRVKSRQDAAVAGLAEAERLFNEMIAAAIEEMDQLPVQDPIASLLQDPTLDEILAQLEAERDLADRLGIPLRPSNLRIIGDWMNPNGDGGLATGGGSLLSAQIRSEMERMNRLSEQMRREALERIKQRVKEVQKPKMAKKPKPKPGAKSTDWNRLVSELDDGLLQNRDKLPPQEYRSAIKQYYEIVNRQSSQEAADGP